MGDTGNALLAAIAITAALYHRERTGVGQAVSTSIVNAGLLHTSYAWIHADGSPADWGHVDGDQYGLSPYYRLYQCSDEAWLFLGAVSDHERERLMAVIDGLEAVSGNPEQVAELLAAQFRRRPTAEWFAQLDSAGVPVELVDEGFCRTLFDDPEAKAAQLVIETWSGSVGRFEDPGFLVKVSPAECVIQRGPAMCGEHSREILLEHGYVDAEVDALAADQAILDAAPDRR